MRKCKRNIFLIFGYLLIMIILFLPYYERYHEHGIRYSGKLKDRKGYVFIPFYISKAIEYKIGKSSGLGSISIQSELLVTEIAVIIFLAGFAYILFCVVLRKEKKEE